MEVKMYTNIDVYDFMYTLGFPVSTVISVRIPKHPKEEAESLGINIKETARRTLKEAMEEEKQEGSPGRCPTS